MDGSKIAGEIEVSDEKLDFTIGEAKRPAGLYRARGSDYTIGWIVLSDGCQVGIETSNDGMSNAAAEAQPRPARCRGERRERDRQAGRGRREHLNQQFSKARARQRLKQEGMNMSAIPAAGTEGSPASVPDTPPRIGPPDVAFAVGSAVAIGLGVYGRLHNPQVRPSIWPGSPAESRPRRG